MPGFGSLSPQTPDEPYPDEGAMMPETYQSPLGKMALAMMHGIYQIPQRLAQYAEMPAGLRREDVTDVPAGRTVTGGTEFGAEPQDQLVKGTAGSAINRLLPGGMPFAARGGLGAFGGRMIQRAAPEEAASGIMPQLAERYPETAPPVEMLGERGNTYLGKSHSPEEVALMMARRKMKPDIEAGNYTPYFDPAQRADVNPRPYGDAYDTTQILKQRPDAIAKAEALATNPEGVKRLEEAYARGLGQKDASGNWYFMKQLEDEFVKEYGPADGRRMFKQRFADAMATTTSGADPTSNLLQAHYANYLHEKGLDTPPSYDVPSPAGGARTTNNLKNYNKAIVQGEGIDPVANPKRYNFSGNFLGRKRASTLDEQMSGLWDPDMIRPAAGSYGHFEKTLQALADKHGVDPRYFQEVAWAGAKDAKTKGGYVAKPMIQHVNEAIERTRRITGLSPSDIVRRGLVRSEIPLYGAAGAVATPVFGSLAPKSQE